jgi:hypothetical protein
MAAGLGLLGTRGSAGFGRAGLMGLNQLEAAKKMQLLEEESRQREAERQSIAEMRQMQVQQMQAALAEAQRKQQQAGQIQQAARDSMLGPAGVAMAGGGGPTVANAAKMDALPQSTRVMDEQGFADRVFEIDPMSGLALRQQMRERNAPVKLSKDDRLIDPTTRQELVGALPAQSEFERQAAEQYGKGTPAYQQAMRNWLLKQSTHAPAPSMTFNTGEKGFKHSVDLANAFRQEPIYKAHQEVTNSYGQITAALENPSGASDLAAATKFMKLLDPGSVVRESELVMAMQTSGLLDRMTNYATQIITGQKLTPTQRQDFRTMTDKLFSESRNLYNQKRNQYAGIAQKYGLDPEVIPAESVPRVNFGGGVDWKKVSDAELMRAVLGGGSP